MSEPGSSSMRPGNDAPSQSTPPRRGGRTSARGSPRTSTHGNGRASGAAQGTGSDESRGAQVGMVSTTSSAAKEAKENAERMHLNNVLNDLNYQVERLTDEIEKLRQQTQAYNEEKQKQMHAFSRVSSAELVMDDEIEAVLRGLDDDALTALLTSSNAGLLQQLTAQPESASATSLIASASTSSSMTQAFLSVPAPALSAGIEGRGTAADMDVRLQKAVSAQSSTSVLNEEPSPSSQSPSKRRRTGAAAATQDHAEDVDAQNAQRREAEHYAWMEGWLRGRKARGEELLASLEKFTGWEIIKLSQQKPSLGAGGNSRVRSVAIHGRMRQIGQVAMRFAIEDDLEKGPPRVVNLEVDLPAPIKEALERDGHLRRLLARNDVPAIFNSLRSLVFAGRTRRRLFGAISTSLPRLCGDSAKVSNALDLGLPTQEQVIGSGRHRRRSSARGNSFMDEIMDDGDEQALAQFYAPDVAELLKLTNERQAELHVKYGISFDAFGRALTDLSLVPQLSDTVSSSSEAAQVLAAMPQQFKKMVQDRPGLEDEPREKAIESITLSITACFFGVAL